MMSGTPARIGPKKALAALCTAVALLGSSCGGDDEAQPTGQNAPASPSPGASGLFDPETPAAPSPGGETPATPGTPEDTGEPPQEGKSTEADVDIVGRGTDPVNERFTPRVVLATNPTEGAAAAEATPAAGAATLLREWDEYGEHAVVAVLGGSQPDSAYRLLVRRLNFLNNGSLLLASGVIDRKQGTASQVISMPWVVLRVDAQDVDTVTKCTIALEGATPFSTPCP
jgi:hypothetical protein